MNRSATRRGSPPRKPVKQNAEDSDSPEDSVALPSTPSGSLWWDQRPVGWPAVPRGLLRLPATQRSVEVVILWLARLEHWLSPGGWLRAWVRLNFILAAVLGVSASTVVPVVAMVLEGVGGWTSRIGLITEDLGLVAARGLPPVIVAVGLMLLGLHLFRRHRVGRSRRYPAEYEDYA